MKKDKIIIVIVFIVIILMLIAIDCSYDEEAEYQRALDGINYYRELCESAGFIFEVEYLKSPTEQKEEIISEPNYVYPKCYELRNNVKIYHNLKTMKYINHTKKDYIEREEK